MKRTNSLLLLPFLFLAIPLSGFAATITFMGASGPSDGTFLVLPYQISIDGTPTNVTCYDVLDDVSVGQTWTANLLSLTQAATGGYFDSVPDPLASYKRVAWLSVQTYSNTDEEIALQHAIWNVFGSVSATPSPEYDAYVNAANAAAVGGYLNFDFSGFVFVEQVGGYPGSTPPSEQAFVFTTTPPTITTAAPTPEPGTISLLAAGGLLILAGRRSRKPASPRGSRS